MRGRWLAGILAILLLASAALNVKFYEQAVSDYRDLNAVRLNPLGLDTYPTDILPPDPRTVRVVLFGDSRALQWPSPDNADPFTFINRGIGAQTSAQIRLRFADHVEPLQPAVLVVQMCMNDLKTIPLFPEHREAIITGCEENIAAVIHDAQSMGTRVVLTTVFPVGEPPLQRWLVWSDEIPQAVDIVNTYIRSLAADDVFVLDAYERLVDSRGLLRANLSVDELHLNAAGYDLLNQSLLVLLNTMGETHGSDQNLRPEESS